VPIFGASDIDVLFADTGVPITVGAVTAKGNVDVADERMLPSDLAHLSGRVRVATVKTSAFAGVLAVGASITVDGVSGFEIVDFRAIDDSGLTHVWIVEQL
jgi:hypothetical protein